MKLFTTIAAAAVTFAAAPVHALPTWANAYARSHCEYLSMGATWEQAVSQAIQDNMHWRAEMDRAKANGLLGKTLNAAAVSTCRALDDEAWVKHKAAKNTSI